jgi:hypothetical protein
MSSVDAGIVIEVSLDPANIRFPILFSLEESSNVIVVMFWQSSKHRSPIASTDDGTMIFVNASQ